MGREANVKSERRQIRLVVKENLPAILQSEALVSAAKELAPLITERLDQIAKATEAELKKLDTQANTFRGYMMRELGQQLSEELGNITGTMLGWQRALTKRMGITDEDMKTFEQEVATEKAAILLELKAEAQLKADKEAAEAKAKAAQDAAGAKAVVEPPKASEPAVETAAPTPESKPEDPALG